MREADFVGLPVVAERLADRFEARGACLLVDLLGEELRELGVGVLMLMA